MNNRTSKSPTTMMLLSVLLIASVALNVFLFVDKDGKTTGNDVPSDSLSQRTATIQGGPSFVFTRAEGKRSDPITDSVADLMSAAYRSHPNSLKTNGAVLEGLKIETADLAAICSNAQYTHVYLMFGIHPSTLTLPVQSQAFTIAAMGVVNDGAEGRIEGQVYDYMDPCPSKCPDNHRNIQGSRK